MPNGYAQERDAVRQRSAGWGFVWRIGDTAYYLGLLASLFSPIVAYSRFKATGVAIALFLLCFPAGLGTSITLKRIARHYTGVGHG